MLCVYTMHMYIALLYTTIALYINISSLPKQTHAIYQLYRMIDYHAYQRRNTGRDML